MKADTENMIKVMQAFADGKRIESASRGCNDWCPVSRPIWDWDSYDYRIKPASTYRPWNYYEIPMGHKLIAKNGKHEFVIVDRWLDGNDRAMICVHGGYQTTEAILSNYVIKSDGTVCGVEE